MPSVLPRLLGVRPGEGRTVALTVSISFFVSVGMMIAQSGVDALFFARYGVDKLPVMYLLLGTLMFGASLGVAVLLSRFGRARTHLLIPLSIGATALAGRVGLISGPTWIYAGLWLLVALAQFAIALSVWGLAGIVTDTRQAKRFFPLIGAGGVLGLVLGGLATRPLAAAVGAENLIVVWAVMLGAVVILGAVLVGAEGRRPVRPRRRHGAARQLTEGLRAVRASSLLRWLALGSMMFSILFFSLYLPFSRAATARYPSPERLAGFFGLFFGLSTAVALLLSLFVTNRVLRRFGVPAVLLVLPVLYVAAFGVLMVQSTFALLAVFRFIQVVWMQGGASSAFEAVVNTVPVDRRDRIRAFLYGGPTQAGTIAAGVIALIGKWAASTRVMFGIGLASAVVATIAMVRVRRHYSRELVVALREGRPNVFAAGPRGEEPFDLGRGDAAAVSVALEGLSDADPHVRRLAAHILGELVEPHGSRARHALSTALRDEDPDVRATALRSLATADAAPAIPEISVALSDPIPEVRLAALDAVASLGLSPDEVVDRIRPALRDPDAFVRAQAAGRLLAAGSDEEAETALLELASAPEPEVRTAAIRSLASSGTSAAFEAALAALTDSTPTVRAQAARSLAWIDPERAADPLIEAMADENAAVRAAVADGLGSIGSPVLARVVASLFDPTRRDGALATLERLPLNGAAAEVRRFAAGAVARAIESQRMAGQVAGDGDERMALLRASLVARSQREAVAALRAAALLSDRSAMSVALENISVSDASQRANALEVIETVGDPELVRPLLTLWDAAPARKGRPSLIDALAEDPDEWIRACAELAALSEGGPMTRTLTTLPLMERVLFLRKMPLFADLPPEDLRPIASIAEEDAFADGEILAQQGDPGDTAHLIVSGEVSIVVRRGKDSAKPVAVRGPGEVIGEMALIASRPRMASLVAKGPVRVLTIARRQFEALLRERPEISLAVMRVLCQRLTDREAQDV
jgi:HEAT repeat protein